MGWQGTCSLLTPRPGMPSVSSYSFLYYWHIYCKDLPAWLFTWDYGMRQGYISLIFKLITLLEERYIQH